MAFPSSSRLEALLEAYQDGSLKAFDEFFLKTKDPFFRYVLRRVGNTEAAQDVTQDVYFRLHRYIASFKKGEGKALYWVLSIIQNCIFDYWAKHKFEAQTQKSAYEGEIEGDSNPEDAFFFKELILQLDKNIDRDELEILLERLVAELSFEEIAERRGIRSDNARQKFFRTLKKIRKLSPF